MTEVKNQGGAGGQQADPKANKPAPTPNAGAGENLNPGGDTPGADEKAKPVQGDGKATPPPSTDKTNANKNKGSNGKDKTQGNAGTAFEFDADEFKESVKSLSPEDKEKLVGNLRKALELLGEPVQEAKDTPAKTPLQVETEKTEAEKEAEHEKMVKRFGHGYVRVTKKDGSNQQNVFSKSAWDRLPVSNDGSKEGWYPIVETPPEVQNLKAKTTKKQ